MAYYIMVDEAAYLSNGEVIISGIPMSFWEIFEKEEDSWEKEPYTYFGIHGIKEFCSLIDALGGKRGEFISFLIKKKDGKNQISNKKISELAREAGVSAQTAHDALKILKDIELIKTSPTNFMINPRLDRRGDRRREALLLNIYGEFCERGKKAKAKEEDNENKNNA